MRSVATGEVYTTPSGRLTKPVPRIDISTGRKATNSIKRFYEWMLEEASEEVSNCRHKTNMVRAIDLKNLSQSDKDTLNIFVFGDIGY